MEIQEEMEIEEYFGYFTPAQGKYVQAWVEAWRSGREVKIEARDLSHAKSMQNMAYRVREIVVKDCEEKRMVPKVVAAAIRAVVPAAGNDGLCFRERKTGKMERPRVREGGWRETGFPASLPAPIPTPAPAPAPAPIPGHYTMEQALAVINGKEKEREVELSAIAKSLDEIPNAAGAMAGAAQASNEFDIKVALAQYKAKPIDPSVRERVSKGMYGDSEPTSEFPTEDELLNAKGNGNDE